MSKFKVVDIAIVAGNTNRHYFDIGENVRITSLNSKSYECEYLDGHDYWYVMECDLKPLKQSFKVGDLVKIIGHRMNHGFHTGELTVITKERSEYGNYLCKSIQRNETYHVFETDIELANKATPSTKTYTQAEVDELIRQTKADILAKVQELLKEDKL